MEINKYRKLFVFVILIVVLILFFPKINIIYENTEKVIKQSAGFSPIVYILLMIVAIVISPIPASPLTILGGAIFGHFLGMLYTLIGATIGAVLAFLIARFFLREYVSKQIEKNKFYCRIKGEDNKNLAYVVFITRLMPHVSFDIVSYAAGLTKLNVFVFALVTFIGMIPIVFLLSFFGFLIQPYLVMILLIISILFILYLIYLIFKDDKNRDN